MFNTAIWISIPIIFEQGCTSFTKKPQQKHQNKDK